MHRVGLWLIVGDFFVLYRNATYNARILFLVYSQVVCPHLNLWRNKWWGDKDIVDNLSDRMRRHRSLSLLSLNISSFRNLGWGKRRDCKFNWLGSCWMPWACGVRVYTGMCVLYYRSAVANALEGPRYYLGQLMWPYRWTSLFVRGGPLHLYVGATVGIEYSMCMIWYKSPEPSGDCN